MPLFAFVYCLVKMASHDGKLSEERFEEKDVLPYGSDYVEDPVIEARVTRKLDLHILPWLFGIWLCAFIDRSNIGNARIDGLTEDLHLEGTMFNTALGMDFVALSVR